MFYNYLVIKPKILFYTFYKVSRSANPTLTETIRYQFSVGWHPLTGTPIACALIIFLFSWATLYRRRGHILVLLVILSLASLIPSIFFYSVILTQGGSFVSFAVLSYLFILIGVHNFILWLFAGPSRQISKV
jgi:hypothetical protein